MPNLAYADTRLYRLVLVPPDSTGVLVETVNRKTALPRIEIRIDRRPAQQIQVLTRLADVRLRLGLSQSKYDEIVIQLKDMLQVMTSPSVIDSFLDVCESLISHPCLSPDARIGFFASTATALARWHRRITSEQLALFRNLCEELGHSFAVAETTVTADSGTEKTYIYPRTTAVAVLGLMERFGVGSGPLVSEHLRIGFAGRDFLPRNSTNATRRNVYACTNERRQR
jgi:hypothetical protein